MVDKTRNDLEGIILLATECQQVAWTKMVKERKDYVIDIAEGLIKYIRGVQKIQVGFFGFKYGKFADTLEKGYITIEPASSGDEILAIEGIEKDEAIKNISIGKAWVAFQYRTNQSIMIKFGYRQKPI